MDDAWQVLVDAGLPLHGRRGEPPPMKALADAVRGAIDVEVRSEREREALVAFLAAWRAHWPTSFERSLGPDAPRARAWAEAHAGPGDRHRKLRRIAIERLSRWL